MASPAAGIGWLSSELVESRGIDMASPAAGIGWLSSELVEEILRRVDGITLAKAGCVCNEFGHIARAEGMWEDACRSMCPSTALDPHLHRFISSSFGGFRKFYAQSFPFVVHKFYGADSRRSDLRAVNSTPSPSDLVSIVDVQYKQRSIYSKVLWGIPGADDLRGWFCNCPFRIELLSFSSSEEEEDAESRSDSPASSINADGISIPCAESMNWKFWGKDVMENMRLSWIVMNRRSMEAVNVSSGSPLGVERQHWGDSVIRFGSILPAAPHEESPGGAVLCLIVMKCTTCADGGELRNLKISELSLHLQDMAGRHVNGKQSVGILERAVGYRRSTDHNEFLECYHSYSRAQNDLHQRRVRSEGRLDVLCLLAGIAAFATFCYFIL